MVLISKFLYISYLQSLLTAQLKSVSGLSSKFENLPCSSVLCSKSSYPSCQFICELHEGKDLISLMFYCLTCPENRGNRASHGVNVHSSNICLSWFSSFHPPICGSDQDTLVCNSSGRHAYFSENETTRGECSGWVFDVTLIASFHVSVSFLYKHCCSLEG